MINFIKRLFQSRVAETKSEIRDWQDPDREENPMACPEITLEGIDGVLYGKLLHQAIAAGAEFFKEELVFQGVTLSWDYDAPSQTLNVTCTKKPFYASCELVEQHVRQLVAKAKESV